VGQCGTRQGEGTNIVIDGAVRRKAASASNSEREGDTVDEGNS